MKAVGHLPDEFVWMDGGMWGATLGNRRKAAKCHEIGSCGEHDPERTWQVEEEMKKWETQYIQIIYWQK